MSPVYEFCKANNGYLWLRDRKKDLMYLRSQETSWNYIFSSRRSDGKVTYITLNQIIDELGFDQSGYGHTVGWVYDPSREEWQNDTHIDFGINDITDPEHPDEPCFLLHFNATPIFGRESYLKMYNAYYELGGNDIVTRMKDEVMNLPIKVGTRRKGNEREVPANDRNADGDASAQ